MAFDKAGQRHAGVAVVEQVAADEQVVALAHGGGVHGRRIGGGLRIPGAMAVFHGRHVVQAQVVAQETRGQRMAVAGRHVHAAPVPHQAGQGQAAAHLQHALACAHGPQRQMRRQLRARGPEQAKHRPHGRRNAHPQGQAQGIKKRLTVEQRTNHQAGNTGHGNALLLGFVAGHGLECKACWSGLEEVRGSRALCAPMPWPFFAPRQRGPRALGNPAARHIRYPWAHA